MLVGYRVALEVHGVREDFDFWSPGNRGPFEDWLWERLGRHSPLGWSVEIEREAEAAGVPAVDLFFSLLDEHRAERDQAKG
ncbi:hypothetical protein ACFQ6S_19855 [Streptomyces sp. NPDC056479]|uniref:hypothetical protein n=1 Tax=Streptomyces sp. NPDC056479 TaxID=3345832 RepID=UPI003696ED41